MNIETIAKERDCSISSVKVQIRRKYGECTYSNTEDLPFTIEELYGRTKEKSTLTKSVQENTKPVNTKEVHTDTKTDKHTEDIQRTYIQSAINTIIPVFLDLVNIIELVLIFIGLNRFFGYTGVVLAVLVSLYMLYAQQKVKTASLNSSNRNALQIVGAICFASFFLHVGTFWTSSQDFVFIHTDIQNVQLYNTYIHLAISIAAALFVSILSFQSVKTAYLAAKDVETNIRRQQIQKDKNK
ncbi:MAG: hypothetical protein KC414_14755 [Romboutsia sp.]|nr:hypothetical protein [Romboutsia sp.]